MYSRSLQLFRRVLPFQPQVKPLERQTKTQTPTQHSEPISQSHPIQKDFTESLHRLEQNYHLERRSIW
ncbi:hypothetical protein ACL6C3_09325 [Capilliphycus salinus ALCB114379]|uniref:hypothetical protein n=1 Tax=Capilliphycus salinus TaxID=2768948 RepID=UPI0039A63282